MYHPPIKKPLWFCQRGFLFFYLLHHAVGATSIVELMVRIERYFFEVAVPQFCMQRVFLASGRLST